MSTPKDYSFLQPGTRVITTFFGKPQTVLIEDVDTQAKSPSGIMIKLTGLKYWFDAMWFQAL